MSNMEPLRPCNLHKKKRRGEEGVFENTSADDFAFYPPLSYHSEEKGKRIYDRNGQAELCFQIVLVVSGKRE